MDYPKILIITTVVATAFPEFTKLPKLLKQDYTHFLQTFTLEFVFEPNEYFTNTVLKKCYRMRHAPEEKDPFSFDAPEIVDCKGLDVV